MTLLAEYQKKRDFSKTAEPKGKTGKKNAQRFCIQQHHARAKHYDLRIELSGVLLSWAIPKGPSDDPKVKRLAVETEPHPLEYLTFEGTIPKGSYGAGKMIVWDIGHYEIPDVKKNVNKILREQYDNGSIDIHFEGKKIKGLFKLVRTSKEKNQWLFFKKKDEFVKKLDFTAQSVLTGRAVTEVDEENNPVAQAMKAGTVKPFPEEFQPMLAKLSDITFSREDWLYEIKYDGYRCVVFKNGDEIRLISRNGNLLNKDYPEIIEAVRDIEPDGIFDGEIIAADETGGGDFQALQNYVRKGRKTELLLVLFDLVYLENRDLSTVPLYIRKAALEKILEPVKNNVLRFSSHIETEGEAYLEAAKELKLEGIIAKQKDSTYLKGKRTGTWLKFKNILDDDLPVIGLTETDDSGRAFGALLLGRTGPKGELLFAGKVGTGFTQKQTQKILKSLEEFKSDTPRAKTRDKIKFWVKPHILAKVKYAEKTADGKLRHPVFLELRKDKFYGDEAQKTNQMESVEVKSESERNKPSRKKKNPDASQKVKRTNTDKIFFPEMGITKGDVLDYYDTIADHILPWLKDKPLTLVRTPNGIKDKGFYQKDVAGAVPDFVETVKVKSKSSDKDAITYAMCNNKNTLLFFANWGCVEFHMMNSLQGNLEHPEHIVFDLDPSGNDIEELKESAFVLKAMFDDWDIHCGLKTSGSRGLHIYVPLRPEYTHGQVRDTAHVIAKIWHQRIPKFTSLARMPDKRKNKIYLDYLQNGRSKTMAAPYSLRVREGVPVSLPITWEELSKLKSIRDYHINNVPELLENRDDPWKGLYRHRLKLETIVEAIEKME